MRIKEREGDEVKPEREKERERERRTLDNKDSPKRGIRGALFGGDRGENHHT